jgi:YD repeat-containing protein
MTAYGAATYTYGPNGDLRTKTVGGQTTTYSYDSLGNPLGAWLPDGRVIEYVADGLNRRVGKKVNGALVEGYLYDGQLRPVAWLDATGAVKATFVYATHVNVPEYMTTSAGTFRILTDHLGSPRLVVDTSSGAVAQRMDYDSFGNVLNDTNPWLPAVRVRGRALGQGHRAREVRGQGLRRLYGQMDKQG